MKHEEIYTNCLAFQLSQARKRVVSWYESYLKPLGLTPPYVYVLGVLMDLDTAGSSDIARLLELEKPSVTTLLDRMERDGFIYRTINPNNRRENVVRMTQKGEEVSAIAYPRLIEADQKLNDLLGGEFTELLGKVKHLNAALKEDNDE